MELITDTSRLRDVCAALATEQFVTLDTEFMRESTYWPDLCLVQMAGSEHQVIVDPLARDLDLTPPNELLENPAVE